jgi:hypothetical protein
MADAVVIHKEWMLTNREHEGGRYENDADVDIDGGW